jgi:hypothetical protein
MLSRTTVNARYGIVVLTFLWLCGLAGGPADAQLIAYEGFNYAPGSGLSGQNGGIGWAGPWNNATGDAQVVSGSLHHGLLRTSGNHIETTSSQQYGNGRELATPVGQPGTTVYVGLLMEPVSPIGSGQYGGYGDVTLGNLYIEGVDGFYGMCNDFGAGQVLSNKKTVQGQTVFLVLRAKFAQTSATYDLFVNPPLNQPLPKTSDATKIDDSNPGPFTHIGTGTGTGWAVDEIRIGWDYANVKPTQAQTPFDANGDGTTDLLFRNASNGDVVLWEMNGFAPLNQGFVAQGVDSSWLTVGTGDFYGDGQADVLWRNSNTGDVYLWEMASFSIINQGYIYQALPLVWQVAGIGDFNGDGMADILWRNTSTGDVVLWEMNATTIQSQKVVSANLPLVWQVAGVGDFNGDGKADILWRNTSTGDVVLWLMNGAAISKQGYIYQALPLVWQVAGIGDFNGDGKADILWRNTSTGDVVVWEMRGTTTIGTGLVASGVGGEWQFAGIGDFNADGMDDVMWRNTATGDVYLWEMNGVNISSQGDVYQALPLAWQIVAP